LNFKFDVGLGKLAPFLSFSFPPPSILFLGRGERGSKIRKKEKAHSFTTSAMLAYPPTFVTFVLFLHIPRVRKGKERKGKERKGKERKGKERKGKERKGKERKGKERKGKKRKRDKIYSKTYKKGEASKQKNLRR
jgi:hypothetical protein